MDSIKLIYRLTHDPSFRRWVLQNNDSEGIYWEKWVEEHPHYQEEVERAQEMVKGIPFSKQAIPSNQIEAAWQKIASYTQTPPKKRFHYTLTFRYAAVVSLLLISGIGLWKGYQEATTIVYETPYGETSSIVLEDGTQVILNANSRLSFKAAWLDQSQRDVFLKGEAYFSVAQRTESDARVPFVVHTNDLSIRVLGTQFNVNSRRGKTQVVLDEGKVAVETPESDGTTMKPGESITYSSENKKMTRQRVNSDIYTSWRNQLLSLNGTSLELVIRQLEDTYGVRFVVPNEALKQRKISSTGSISAESLDTILSALSALLQVKIQKDSNTIYLYEN